MKIILRIIALPFVYGLFFVTHNYVVIVRTILFLRYGGEWINYDKEMSKKSIQDVYEIIHKQYKTDK